jgi:Domain of unknown function (DUF4190)
MQGVPPPPYGYPPSPSADAAERIASTTPARAHPAQQSAPENAKAHLALILGLLSVTCLGGFVTGIPAVIFGLLAKRDIELAAGSRRGLSLALTGIVTGVLGTLTSSAIVILVAASALDAWNDGPAHQNDPETSGVDQDERVGESSVPVETPSHSTAPTLNPHHSSRPSTPHQSQSSQSSSIGRIQVITLASSSERERDLERELFEIHQHAPRRVLMLQTTVANCSPCQEFRRALSDTRMQKALKNVTLIEVDMDAYRTDLSELLVDTKTVPWFYTFDSAMNPVDAISAGEWDENVAPNMAPVFTAFLAGKLHQRRTPSMLHGPEL